MAAEEAACNLKNCLRCWSFDCLLLFVPPQKYFISLMASDWQTQRHLVAWRTQSSPSRHVPKHYSHSSLLIIYMCANQVPQNLLYDSICIVLFGSTKLNTDVVVQYVTVKWWRVVPWSWDIKYFAYTKHKCNIWCRLVWAPLQAHVL